MRHLITILSGVALLWISPVVQAEDHLPWPDGLSVREPYAALSADEIKSKLVVLIITDDDPMEWKKQKEKSPDAGKLGGGPDVWCGQMLRRSFTDLLEERPDLKDRCLLQRQPVGLPKVLRSARSPRLPSRAVTAICDGSYRLLSFAIGVPDPNEMISLIEDAEETQLLLKYHARDVAVVRDEIALRCRPRLRRIYQDTFDQTLERIEPDANLNVINTAWASQLARIVNQFKPLYFQDVKLRFSFNDPNDLIRLLVLEQHCETRSNWCDCLAPFVLGHPIRSLSGPLLDTAWGMPPVIEVDPDEHRDLLTWFNDQRNNATLILAIKTTLLDLDRPWPPMDLSGKKHKKRDWNALESAMSHHEYRNVTLEAFAVLLQSIDSAGIDPFFPSRARYVIFERGKASPTIVREGDIPGKFIARLE